MTDISKWPNLIAFLKEQHESALVNELIEDELRRKSCCEEFAKARCLRTDSEGWGSLISRTEEFRCDDDEDEKIPELFLDGWRMGSYLKNLRFCPWCGKSLVETKSG